MNPNLRGVHYAQMILAGLIQSALVMAVAMPQIAHYCLIGCVALVALLSPLGLASPAMLQVDPALTSALSGQAPAPSLAAPAAAPMGFAPPAQPPAVKS